MRRPSIPLFKSDSMDDYNRFRSMMQALDLCVLDLSHHQYNGRHIVAACMYIQLGLTFEVFTRQQISMTPDIFTVIANAE